MALRILKIGGLVVVVLAVLLFVGGSGMIFILQAPFRVAFGWVKYLRDTLPGVPVNVPLVLAGVAALAAAAALFHGLAKKLTTGSERQWRAKWTVQWTALVVLMFAIGAAAIGVVHQSAWLATMPEPFAERDPRWRTGTALARLWGEAYAFWADHDRWPTAEELEARVPDKTKWLDGHRTPVRYVQLPNGAAEIRSAGADRVFGTDDDVVRTLKGSGP